MAKGEVKDAAMKFLVPDTCVRLTHKLIGEATRGWAHKVHDAATFLFGYALNRVIVMNRASLAHGGFIK